MLDRACKIALPCLPSFVSLFSNLKSCKAILSRVAFKSQKLFGLWMVTKQRLCHQIQHVIHSIAARMLAHLWGRYALLERALLSDSAVYYQCPPLYIPAHSRFIADNLKWLAQIQTQQSLSSWFSHINLRSIRKCTS